MWPVLCVVMNSNGWLRPAPGESLLQMCKQCSLQFLFSHLSHTRLTSLRELHYGHVVTLDVEGNNRRGGYAFYKYKPLKVEDAIIGRPSTLLTGNINALEPISLVCIYLITLLTIIIVSSY